MESIPPIEVYQIGDVYFVRDGNHRVSVARANGLSHIEAYVTVLDADVPLEPDVQPDDLIIKAEYAEFLRRTRLKELRPDVDIRLTEPGRYQQLLEHIDVHRYYLGLEQGREIPYEEAAVSWYDHVFCPVIQAIRESGVIREFPRRTETDLYLWVVHHREQLRERFGIEVSTDAAASDFARSFSERPVKRMLRGVSQTLRTAVGSGEKAPAARSPEPDRHDAEEMTSCESDSEN